MNGIFWFSEGSPWWLRNWHRGDRTIGERSAAIGLLLFEAGSLTQAIPLAGGAHAVEYRFVLAATGQATAMAELGATVVP